MIAGARVALWVRLDRPGNDACRFVQTGRGLLIEGQATEADGTVLHYRLRAGPDGLTRRARIGTVPMLTIRRDSAGRWFVNEAERPDCAGATDFDLGVTPATNTLALRRLDLAIGASAEALCAWLDPTSWVLRPLRQTYARLSATEYDYASETGFRARITVDEEGIVTRYGTLWEARG